MIREAIDAHDPLKGRKIKVIAQGSYRNNTNVKQESDVDICVCCMDPFYTDYEFAGYGDAEVGNQTATYTYAQFKNEVEAALRKKFGNLGVKRGDKAFDVHANNYRVDADVVAAFAHRRYLQKYHNLLLNAYMPWYTEPEGTQFFADSGKKIVNWPEQHYKNGAEKNKRTGYCFKLAARALKNLKYEMESQGNAAQKQAAKEAASYLIECLVYNAPDSMFTSDSYYSIVRNIIIHCYNATKRDEDCKSWLEVNEMKYLFHPTQPWTRAQANTFLLEAWRYGEFS